MKKRGKAKLIALLLGLMALFTLAGCQLGVTIDQIISGNNLTAQVTYYANGGQFDGGGNIKEMYYKAESRIFNIKETSVTVNGTAEVKRGNHSLLGWYEVELNQDGSPKFEDEENLIPVLSDTPVDFAKKIQEGDHWYVGAKWQAKVNLVIQLVCDEGVEIQEKGVASPYKNGDKLRTFSYDAGTNAVQAFPEIQDEQGGQVFVEYYNEPECITPVDFPVKQLDGQETDRILYAKYIDSSWTVVRSADEFATMWKNPTADKKYWIARDIDLRFTSLAPMENFACEVQGNHYTVHNLKVTKKDLTNTSSVALFGNIAASGVMKNLTFENAKAEYTLHVTANLSTKIYFVFTSLAEGADIENVNFTGTQSSLRITKQLNQLFKQDSIDTAACLYGGFANDAEYTSAHENGFKVTFDTAQFIRII